MIQFLPKGIAALHHKLSKLTSKLQRTASNIGFTNKCKSLGLTPTFARVKGNFKCESDRFNASKLILNSNLVEQKTKLRSIIFELTQLQSKIRHNYGLGALKLLQCLSTSYLRQQNTKSLQTKNNKILGLLRQKSTTTSTRKNTVDNYKVPIINLSDIELTDTETRHLKYGLQQSFVDKNKHIKLDIASELEILAFSTRNAVEQEDLDDFHHFLRCTTNRFTKNIYHAQDKTWKSLYNLSKNEDIVVLQGDKDSSVVILPRTAYINKVQSMIDDGIEKRKYQPTTDDTLDDLQSFQGFLYRNFRNNPASENVLPYDKIRPSSNQPAFLYTTAKTHKFENHQDITIDNLKLRPIVSTCGTYYYQTTKYLAKYLLPLSENDYSIKNTLDFADILENHTLQNNEMVVSYDVTSLFTEIPLDETIEYILDQIYVQNKLKPLASRLIFKRLLNRVTKGSVFSFNGQLYKQINGCGMGNPLSPVLANIFMCKLENNVLPLHKPTIYKRYVDDCFSTRIKNEKNDHLLDSLSKYHDNIDFTVEENPDHFLDTAFTWNGTKFERSVYQKPGKLPVHWSSQTPLSWKRNSIVNALHRAKRITTNWGTELVSIKSKFTKAGYPRKFIENTIKNFEHPRSDESTIIPTHWFDEPRKTVSIRIPFCVQNEKESSSFLKKLYQYTHGQYKFNIIWQTRKIQSLFTTKDKNNHPSKVIYEGECESCQQKYIGETERNFSTRKREHEDASSKKPSEPARHIAENPSHQFTWRIIGKATYLPKRRTIEAFMIQKHSPSLNKQLDCYHLTLFPHGIT